MKYLALLLVIVVSCSVQNADFNSRYFNNTDWFTDNLDSTFYIADTVKFIQYTTKSPKEWPGEYSEFELKHLKHGDFIQFKFRRKGRLNLVWRTNNAWHKVPGYHWNWNFDSKKSILSISDENYKQLAQFKPIKEREVKLKSRFWQHKDSLTTTELTLIRLN